MKRDLLIDFGASRVKTAVIDGAEIVEIKDFSPVLPEISFEKGFEVSPEKLSALFFEILKSYENIQNIFICSEMHGFVLADESGNFLTNYISWKDNRATEKIGGISTLDFFAKQLPSFKEHTGMSIKAGLPAINLVHLLREKKIQGRAKIMSLPEILTNSSTENKIHITMLAGLGIWDIYKNAEYEEFFELCRSLGCDLTYNKPVFTAERIESRENIHAAVGDNQCAMLGVGLKENELCLNLGTGSQVVIKAALNPCCQLEQRPYFDGENISVITYIPSGRALNVFVGFIQEISAALNAERQAWDFVKELSVEDIENATLDFDLAVFESAYGYSSGGSINKIAEHNLNLKNYFASLIKSYIHQYLNIIEKYNINYSKIILSGGIPSKTPCIKTYLEKILQKSVSLNNENDETIIGLMKIAKKQESAA